MNGRDPKRRKRCRRCRAAALCLVALCLVASLAVLPARAIESLAKDQPIAFKADEVTYDSRNKITRATGNVEAVQAGRRVAADTVVYDELRNVVTAEGNVTLYEPSGEVVSGKSIELSGDLKSGVVEDLRAILADGSRLTAVRAPSAGTAPSLPRKRPATRPAFRAPRIRRGRRYGRFGR